MILFAVVCIVGKPLLANCQDRHPPGEIQQFVFVNDMEPVKLFVDLSVLDGTGNGTIIPGFFTLFVAKSQSVNNLVAILYSVLCSPLLSLIVIPGTDQASICVDGDLCPLDFRCDQDLCFFQLL